MRRALGCLLFWLAFYLLAGCRHTYQHQQSAQRTEQENRQFQTAARAEENKQSVETTKTASKRVVEKFRPDGTLLERMTEQSDSDGRVEVRSESASQSTATGSSFRSVVASSSSSTKADTRAGWWSPWWLLLLVPVAGAVWFLRRRIRAFIPWG